MKLTQEQVIAWAREAGFDIDDEGKLYLAIVHEVLLKANYQGTVVDGIKATAALAYEAGRKDENEAIAQMIEDAPPLVDFAKNEQGGCVICGFTPKLAAFTIRERMRHE